MSTLRLLILEGNKVRRFGYYQKERLPIIDLWASWCMPCRAKAKAMIPIYEKYKDRGFEIVGVAQGVQEYANGHEAGYRTQDGYPWLQLVELDDGCQKLWTQLYVGKCRGRRIFGRSGREDSCRESETGRGAEDFRAEIRRVVLSMNKAETFFVSRKRFGFMI